MNGTSTTGEQTAAQSGWRTKVLQFSAMARRDRFNSRARRELYRIEATGRAVVENNVSVEERGISDDTDLTSCVW